MKLADRKNIVDMGLDPDDLVSYAGGWVAHRAPEALRAEYEAIAGDPDVFHSLGGYAPTRGLPGLREALLATDAEFYGTRGLTDDHIIVGASSTQLTYSLFVALLDPGDSVVVFDPAYANYSPQLALCQEDIQTVHLSVIDPATWSFCQDADRVIADLERILEEHTPRLLLFSSPDNPTGQMVPDDLFDRILDVTRDAGCFVAVDQAYRMQHFLDEEPRQLSASPVDHPHLIRLHSNSKWCRGLGRRLGWIEAAPEIVNALEIVQQATSLCGDTVHQHALAEYLRKALADGSLRSYLADAKAEYQAAAQRTSSCIEKYLGLRHMPPQGGLYTVVDVERDGDEFVLDVLRNTGVIFVPGSGFGPSLNNAIRVSYGPLVQDLDRLEEGFRRVRDYLNG